VSPFVAILFVLTWAAVAFSAWVAYNLLRQNGRMLLRVEALEAEIARLAPVDAPAEEAAARPPFGDRSLAGSRINRDGLRPGTAAPGFTLPRLGGGELSLSDYATRRLLLVFSDPNCGPCDVLAPRLERFAKDTPGVSVVMVSRGDVEENRRKVEQFGLTFPVVLQEQWQLSRQYAKFATPIAYLIDEQGRIAADVALGVDAILELPSVAAALAASRH
jgi:peroxiredoxin